MAGNCISKDTEVTTVVTVIRELCVVNCLINWSYSKILLVKNRESEQSIIKSTVTGRLEQRHILKIILELELVEVQRCILVCVIYMLVNSAMVEDTLLYGLLVMVERFHG